MVPHLLFYQLAVLGLLWLCVMLHAAWPSCKFWRLVARYFWRSIAPLEQSA